MTLLHVAGDVGTRLNLSFVPRPCAFVACSMKFTQRAWARSSCDLCRSLVTAISLKINDVIEGASAAFYVERGSQRSQ